MNLIHFDLLNTMMLLVFIENVEKSYFSVKIKRFFYISINGKSLFLFFLQSSKLNVNFIGYFTGYCVQK